MNILCGQAKMSKTTHDKKKKKAPTMSRQVIRNACTFLAAGGEAIFSRIVARDSLKYLGLSDNEDSFGNTNGVLRL